MSHMFCTLQEAAQTLNASEDQIQALLEQGLLREFREGPHRLLKEADVGALAREQAQRRDPGARAGRSASGRLPRAAPAGSRPPHVPGPQDAGSETPPHGIGAPDHRRRPHTDDRAAASRRARETGLRRPDRRPSGRVSLRQWFWMGLVQDRPAAIALLSGVVLALLAALVAGLCFLTQAP